MIIKLSRHWDDLSYDEQKGYLSRHHKSKRRITAVPGVQSSNIKAEVNTAEIVEKNKIKQILSTIPSLGYVKLHRDGSYTFKENYFYRHGQTAQGFAFKIRDKTKVAGLDIDTIEWSDNWNAWPKDSWFEAKIKFKLVKPEDNLKEKENLTK